MTPRIDIEDMTDAQDEAPERIWADRSPFGEHSWVDVEYDGGTLYVRADLARPSQAGDERVAAAYRDALQLATAIWERAYREVAPDWKPLPDLLGVLSQIDNMVAGLLSRAESQAAEQMRLRSENLRMRASLEPFAKEAGAWEDSCDQEQLVEPFPGYDGLLTVGNCRRARAALAAMDTPKGGGDGWQPIETVPKETDVLIWESGDVCRASLRIAGDEAYWECLCTQPVVYTPEPTHWMPLPPAPPAAMKDGG